MKYFLYSAIVGAGLWIFSEFLEMDSLHGSTPLSLWITTFWHPIIALGFWGLHLAQSPHKNTLSLVGTILLIVSFIGFTPVSLMILNSPVQTFSAFLNQNPGFQIFGICSLLGYILFGISVIKTKYYPFWTGHILILSIFLSAIQSMAELAEIWQHISFICLSCVVIFMSVFGLEN
ncbi:MAG: hypothetical protein WAT79_02865 [Saprospiraceae bacterium]